MNDLVERLRSRSSAHEWDRGRDGMLDEAANEIERLRMSREDYEGMLPPSMRGGGMKLWGWVIPRGGKKKPVILSADTHDEISAICEEEIHNQGYLPLYHPSQPHNTKQPEE